MLERRPIMAPESPTSAIFRALRSVDVDPELAHEAAEETRHGAGQKVIAAVGAKIDSKSARIDVQITEFRAEMATHFTRPPPSDTQRTDLPLAQQGHALGQDVDLVGILVAGVAQFHPLRSGGPVIQRGCICSRRETAHVNS